MRAVELIREGELQALAAIALEESLQIGRLAGDMRSALTAGDHVTTREYWRAIGRHAATVVALAAVLEIREADTALIASPSAPSAPSTPLRQAGKG